MTTETKPKKWLFPSPVRCPRCKGYNTIVVHTDPDEGMQHMRCRGALCRSVKWVNRGTPNPCYQDAADSPSFDCPHCQNTYKRQGDLTKHINKAHPGQTGERTNGTGTGQE